MKIKYLIFAVALSAAAVISFLVLRNRDKDSGIEIVRYRDIGYTVAATGKVEGWKEADISVKSPGRIEFVSEEGRHVKKGNVLVSLDNGELRARREEASHTLRQAEMDLERYRGLFEKGYMSKRDFDLADTEFKKASANVKMIQELINDTVLRAPFNCVVVKKYKEIGETVGLLNSYEPVLKIADLERLKIRAEIEESDIGKIKPGLAAEITSDAYKGEAFKGDVLNVGYAAGKKRLKSDDPKEPVDVKVVESEIEVIPTEKLKIGMTVDVKINSPLRTNVLSVSKKSVIRENDESFVRLVEGKDVRKVRIKTGASDDVFTEVLEGIKEGDRVLTSPR